jgi:hypothetical protein
MAARRSTLMATGLLTIAGLFSFSGCGGKPTETAATNPKASSNAPPEAATNATLAAQIRQSNVPALAELYAKLENKADPVPKGLTEGEGAEWVEMLNSIRAGYLQFSTTQARMAAIDGSFKILQKFSADPAPKSWLTAIAPFRDIICSGLRDKEFDVRVTSLNALAKVWNWSPGRTLLPVEEEQLGEWKNAFHKQVVLSLADSDPRGRAAAVDCLSKIPVDAPASPALAYLEDPSGHVRQQVMVSYAARPALLTEDMIIKRLHDSEMGVPQMAEIVLKGRGLTKDQIALGRMISSPKPELRASVIPLLREHDDLDPVVWLLKLSHDTDENVRAKAVEAMTGKDNNELRNRLREMAAKDTSAVVRAAASKLVAQLPQADTTAALPPLPGSPKLTPRAN